MSKVIKPIMTDETGQSLVESIKTQNVILGLMSSTTTNLTTDLAAIRKIVQSGKARDFFNPGDQIIVPWKDGETEYQMPMDIVHFGDVTLKDGEVVPGMYLQCHYATPYGVQFDAQEAFYYASDILPAGTYNITVGTNWGTNCVNGKTYQFTLSKPVPQKGLLVGFYAMPDQAPSNWRVSSYETGLSTSPIETVTVSEGSDGTSLGSFIPAGTETLNSLHRLSYGYNRWSQSALRQWLNSSEDAGKWWSAQNKFDRVPDQLSTKSGFMKGFNDEFLSCIQPIKVTTALNTVTDSADGTLEDTYDTFFIPSLEQMSINPQLSGEGDTWEYWKRASGLTTKMNQYGTYPQIRTFALENHTSPQSVRLRSAGRGNASYAWYVYSSGYIHNYNAINAHRCAPACVIS